MPVCRRGYKGVRILMCVCIRTRDSLRDTCIKGGVAGVTINKGQAYLRQQDYTRHPIYSGVALYTVSVTIFLIFVAAVFTIFLNFSDRQLPRTKMHRYAVLFMHQLTASQRLKACMHGHWVPTCGRGQIIAQRGNSLLWIMATIRVGASYGGSHRMRAAENLQTSGLAYVTLLVMHLAPSSAMHCLWSLNQSGNVAWNMIPLRPLIETPRGSFDLVT